jgi:peptidoglycan/LPS O-acetylase OafA/YrhL
MLAGVFVVNQLMNFGILDALFTWIYGRPFQAPVMQATYTPIALGVLLAHLLHGSGTFRSLYYGLGRRGTSVVLAFLLVALVVVWPGDISGLGRLSIQVTMMLFLGTVVVRDDNPCRPLLTMLPLAQLGVISYGVYLYHMWVIHPIQLGFARLGWDPKSLVFFLCSVIACTIVAGLSYRCIERPLLKLKSRFRTGPAETDQSLRTPAYVMRETPVTNASIGAG